ncbi:MAG: hypothetical protein HYZ37_02040 [Candidatus Solibacter usitatus]|nr:hypothetical protein [Candidatus Solibacter usitatus]
MKAYRENWGLKLASVALALGLWMATVGNSGVTASVSVPVQYRNIDANLEVSSALVENVFVEMRGPAGRLNAASLQNAIVALDVSAQQTPGERTYPITGSIVSLPPGVKFLRAVPSQVRLKLEKREVRELPVLVRLMAVPKGFRVVSQKVEPATVRVIGPASRVAAIDRIETDLIELGARAGEQVINTHPYAGDPMVRLERSGEVVVIRIELEQVP